MSGLDDKIIDRWTATRGPLFTDMYELTMAQVYVSQGISERRAQFDYFFRSAPDYGTHQAGFCVSAGLAPFLGWLDQLSIEAAARRGARRHDLADGDARVRHRRSSSGSPHRSGSPTSRSARSPRVASCTHTSRSSPVTGPLAVAQLLETSLLNHLNYPTLIATKAARVVRSARGGQVLEFGMRRGPSTGVNEGIRAALIGGCVSTSNVEAAIALGRQPIGTHAHSLVQAYLAIGDGELGAFRAMAATAPDECILLVDTIDTLDSGVPNAITVFDELRAAGHEPVGVRLDSGDLAYLAVQTAKLLDDAGFPDVSIVLSSDLDELNIWQILTQIGDDAERLGHRSRTDPPAARLRRRHPPDHLAWVRRAQRRLQARRDRGRRRRVDSGHQGLRGSRQGAAARTQDRVAPLRPAWRRGRRPDRRWRTRTRFRRRRSPSTIPTVKASHSRSVASDISHVEVLHEVHHCTSGDRRSTTGRRLDRRARAAVRDRHRATRRRRATTRQPAPVSRQRDRPPARIASRVDRPAA